MNLKKYENDNPSRWDRTEISMIIEWLIHNYLYDIRMYQEHTESVDLNNEDENVLKLINKIVY